MHSGPDFLHPLDVVTIDGTAIVPDLSRPVAALVHEDGPVRWVTWPDAVLPDRAIAEGAAWPVARGVWVVYSSDGIDDEQRTAVFVGPDGTATSVDLGDLRPVGTDEDGLWVGDPRDASAWTEHPGEVEDIGPGLDEVDPKTLPWAESDDFWPDRATWVESGDAEDDTGGVEPPDDEDSVVATAAQWTIEFGGPSDDDAEDESVWEPPRPVATTPTDLVRIGSDGSRTVLHVDHLADRIRVDGDRLTVRFHPTGPRSVDDPIGGAWDLVYEPREVTVDVSAGIPSEIRTDALDSVPAETDEDEGAWERSIDEREARRTPWIDRVDLAGVAGRDWSRRKEDEVAAPRHVARLREQFTGLGAPSVGWTRETDGPLRFPSDYRSVVVDVEGEWPRTEVVVSFEHRAVPFLRLRRRYRVFDDSGRPVDWGYVTVYLEEDIATRHIPPRSAAEDGVLDI